MTDPATLMQWGAAIICTLIVSIALLKAWNGWLDVRRLEIGGRSESDVDAASPAGRITLADLKQRVRRLEALAEVIELPDARGRAGR